MPIKTKADLPLEPFQWTLDPAGTSVCNEKIKDVNEWFNRDTYEPEIINLISRSTHILPAPGFLISELGT